MKKRLFWSLVTTCGSSLGALALYTITHPAVMLLATNPQVRVSDRESKCGFQLVVPSNAHNGAAHVPHAC